MTVRTILLSNKAPFTVIGRGEVLTPVGRPWEPVGRLEVPGLSDRLAINASAAMLKSLRDEARRLRYEVSDAVCSLASLAARRQREQNGRMLVKVDRWIGRATTLRDSHAARLGVILPEIERLEGDPKVEARIEAIEEEMRQEERDRLAAWRRDRHAML